jgi:hypothetical protein
VRLAHRREQDSLSAWNAGRIHDSRRDGRRYLNTMQNQSPDRLEIFLALALKSGARQTSAGNFMPAADDYGEAANEKVSAVANYLTEKETEKFKRLQTNYRNKTETEKAEWLAEILHKIGTDETLIDETVHASYVSHALRQEVPAVQKILFNFLLPAHQAAVNTPSEKPKKNNHPHTDALEKSVRRAFAAQFVSLRDLSEPTAFDRLNGAQLARLIRLTGIHEVALACLQIEAVESVAAFLRIFSAEDAQAIAAQLNSVPEKSETRLAFAETLVQKTMEIESNPSAMLDLIGIRLVGVLLCDNPKERVIYTNQKLPIQIAPQLPKIIEEQCRRTPPNLQTEIEKIARSLRDRRKPTKSIG